jgi:dCTP deaminase
MILNDITISGLARGGMITPFARRSARGPGGTSYGLSSYGYDVRIADEWVQYEHPGR